MNDLISLKTRENLTKSVTYLKLWEFSYDIIIVNILFWRYFMNLNLLQKAAGNDLRKTGAIKKISVPGAQNDGNYDVYAIPLDYLYYNDQNGRINTTYKQYQASHGLIKPEVGDSEYNKIFEKFIYDSNPIALDETLRSIKEKTQQEPGVVLADGRVIDGNRRFTALRKKQRDENIPQTFEAIIVSLDVKSDNDAKIIKELELDLQLGREERISYNPIDRIFDVYNTIVVEKIMTPEEYKKASGAGNTKGINRDIKLAELIIRFIEIVSPGGNPVDKFYLARDLKLDGPIEEIGGTLEKLKQDKEAITDAVLVNLVVAKSISDNKDVTRIVRDLKSNVLKNPDVCEHYIDAVDDKVDVVVDFFEKKPISSANCLKTAFTNNEELKRAAEKMQQSTRRLIHKGKNDAKRKKSIIELEDVRDNLKEMTVEDFEELTQDEFLDAKDILKEITDITFKLKRDINQKGHK